MKVAVIVGRFQIDTLHVGHQNLIGKAYEECDRVIVLVGTRIVRSETDPLPYYLTSRGTKTQYGTTEVYELPDKKEDSQWIEALKTKIDSLTNEDDEVFYYGSRDSFLQTIADHKNIVELREEVQISATEVRNSISYEDDRMFKRGYIKAVQDEFKAHYAVVDALITDGKSILLGKKESGYCIVGGFADACDLSLEDAIIREVLEETNLEVSNPKYLMSAQCRDWRYTRARQPFTAVYVLEVENFSGAIAQDDLDDIIIVPLEEAENYLEEGSGHLNYVREYIKTL